MPSKQLPTIAAGMRVRCRDAEWLVTSVESSTISGGEFAVHCLGVDELVRGHEAVFLTQLDSVEPVDPANVRLIHDSSTGFERSQLFLEAQLRSMPCTSQEPDLDRLGAFDVLPYQRDAVKLALAKLRPRLLIADSVGLGKTIQIGMILSELERRRRANRVLVLTKKSMLTQFQSELWNRFAFPLVRLDSVGIAKLRLRIPANKNPFEVYHRIIMSIDTLKDVGRYRHFLEDTRWDAVVIDEAHNVAAATSASNHFSYRLARLLAGRSDAFILASATPHNGKRETFGRLMGLIDPTSIADPSFREYSAQDIKGLYLMRFRQDVRGQAAGQFKEPKYVSLSETTCMATPAEEAIYEGFAKLRVLAKEKSNGRREGNKLLEYGLYKLFLSSPEAASETVRKRLVKDCLSEAERTLLAQIQADLQNMSLRQTARYQILKRQLELLGWDGRPSGPRVLIFTEYRETQNALCRALARDFALKYSDEQDEQASQVIAAIHGSFNDVKLTDTVEAFVTGSSPVRMLVATDVASEGINLHHECHLLIHYDLPWSIITLVQRNGRIDRYGQKENPLIHYLVVRTDEGLLKGDEEIFERLIAKVAEINRTRQDGASVLKFYDPKEEEAYVAESGILAGNTLVLESAAVDERSQEARALEEELRQAALANADELQQFLLGVTASGVSAEEETGAQKRSGDRPSKPAAGGRLRLLTDADFFNRGYQHLVESCGYGEQLERTSQLTILRAPEPLRRYLGDPAASGDMIFGGTAIAEEAFPDNGEFRFSSSPQRVQQAIQAARNTKGFWSKEALCCEQHPVMKWIAERLLMLVSRGEVPFVVSPALAPGEVIFCFIGQMSSRSGTPLIVDPHSVWFQRNGERGICPLGESLNKAQLGTLANPGIVGAERVLKASEVLIPSAVSQSLDHLRALSLRRIGELRGQVAKEERRLRKWVQARQSLLQQKLGTLADSHPAALKVKEELRASESLKQSRERWIQEELLPAEAPSTQLVLAIGGLS